MNVHSQPTYSYRDMPAQQLVQTICSDKDTQETFNKKIGPASEDPHQRPDNRVKYRGSRSGLEKRFILILVQFLEIFF